MKTYKPPLSVYFIWHPADTMEVTPIINHCRDMLNRDIEKPFSRAMNLPVFYRTTLKKSIPSQVEVKSKHAIFFFFLGNNILADQEWIDYIDKLPKGKNIHRVPIALDENAFNLNQFNEVNYIRFYNFKKETCNHMSFISIAHEIFRLVLNEHFDEMKPGIDNALEIFLSHAKDGKHGLKLAKELKNFIDNTSMRNFFDTTDIAPGYRFDKEIVGHIKRSTLIAIHSDPYSSRYWCQREIMCAKENKRPMIAVDCLEEFEDRRFPFAANIPSIHFHLENGCHIEEGLLRILSAALLETIRFHHAKLILEHYKDINWAPADAEILSRPPEAADIIALKKQNDECGGSEPKNFIYPEPPVYEDELTPLKCIGHEFFTPLSCNFANLNKIKIGLSISNPSDEELIAIGHNGDHLIGLSQDIARHLLARGATLVYGGDLREDGYTDFIFKEAFALQSRLRTEDIHLENHISWPIYLKDSNMVKEWKAMYRKIAKMEEVMPPDDVIQLIPDNDQYLSPTNTQNLFVWSRCLTKMRSDMIESCDIRICAGGRLDGYKGKMPGVLEEILLAIEKEKPLFLLGGFGGVTSSFCRSIQQETLVDELTRSWQINHNPGYNDLLEFASSKGYDYSGEYELISDTITNLKLNNGLSAEDNDRLFETEFIDEAIYLILKGISAINTS